MNKRRVEAGKIAAFSLSKYKGQLHPRRGMVLLDKSLATLSIWTFRAELKILHHSTTVNIGYQPVINCGSVKQTATITQIEGTNIVRTGDTAIITFKFMYRPEYIQVGQKIVIREDKTRGVGRILSIG